MSVIPKKLLIVGDRSVGKSSLLMKFSKDEFPEDVSSYVLDIFKEIQVDDKLVELECFDIHVGRQFGGSGTCRYRQHIDVILICFSIDCPQSWTNIRDYWEPLMKAMPKFPASSCI